MNVPEPDAAAEAIGNGEVEHHRPLGNGFLVAFVIGWCIIGVGAYTALADARDAHPFAIVVHIVAFALLHDLVIAPIALVASLVIGRLAPVWARGALRAALACTAMVLLFSYPLVRRWGERPGNASALPLEYGRNVVWIVIGIWALAAAVALRRRRQASLSMKRSVSTSTLVT